VLQDLGAQGAPLPGIPPPRRARHQDTEALQGAWAEYQWVRRLLTADLRRITKDRRQGTSRLAIRRGVGGR